MFSDRNLLIIGAATNLFAGYALYQVSSAGYQYQDCVNRTSNPESCDALNDRQERMKIVTQAAIGIAAAGVWCICTWAMRKLSKYGMPQFGMPPAFRKEAQNLPVNPDTKPPSAAEPAKNRSKERLLRDPNPNHSQRNASNIVVSSKPRSIQWSHDPNSVGSPIARQHANIRKKVAQRGLVA